MEAKRVMVVNHSKDTRYGQQCIATHNGVIEPCTSVQSLMSIVSTPEYQQAECVYVEEAQFFGDLETFVIAAVERDGKDVTVCGLDGDFMRRPFHCVLDLIPLADSVSRMTQSRCSDCGKKAIFSRRINSSTDILLVGGSESYAPACRACWRPVGTAP